MLCRFLVYNPMMGRSHVTFIAKLADTLVEAGHDVVSLSAFQNLLLDAYMFFFLSSGEA